MSVSTKARVQKIRAISSTVADLERSLQFYTQALSFKPISDITREGGEYSQVEGLKLTRIRVATLQIGDEIVELIQYLDLEGKPIPPDSQSNDLWFQHLAIVVSDLDRAYHQLKPFLVESISTQPQTLASGIRAFKFKDPDRHNLELIWFPPGEGRDKWHSKTEDIFLGIDHSAIAIADTDRSLQFYRDLLGLEAKETHLNSGETQANLDGLPEANVKITQVRPQQGGLGIELLDYILPGTGRPFPHDWQSCDIVTMQIQLIVGDIEETVKTLRENGVEIISPNIISFPNSHPYRRGCLVRDPSGHAIRLIAV